MNHMKLDDLNSIPLEEIKWKLDKKYGEMAAGDEINEIGKEIGLYELRPISLKK